MSAPDDANKRKFKRHYLIYYLRVFDRKTGEILGHLVDVNEKGVMLMRDSPIEIGREYNLRLRWRNSLGKLQVVDFEAICKWCRPDVNPDFYGAGFTINLNNSDDLVTMRNLVSDLGMPE